MDLSAEIVFSGRFDPPHPGHIATVMRLAKKFSAVNVVILDSPERSYPIEYVKTLFEEVFEKLTIHVCVNKTHFGKMTIEEWNTFHSDYYAAGNLSVLRHMEKLGVKCHFVDRAYNYSASDYKRLD